MRLSRDFLYIIRTRILREFNIWRGVIFLALEAVKLCHHMGIDTSSNRGTNISRNSETLSAAIPFPPPGRRRWCVDRVRSGHKSGAIHLPARSPLLQGSEKRDVLQWTNQRDQRSATFTSLSNVGSDRAKRGCENHLFYLPTSQLLELDLPSIVSFPFLFFHSILDFRATETRLVIY